MLRVVLFSSVMMIRWLVIGLAVYLTSWVVLVALAGRLPPGLLREVAEFLPACVTAARRLRRCPDVPRRAKLALLAAVLWVVSPIDLLPEFLPVIGPLDDVVAVVLLLRYAARSVPRPVLLAAWPAEPRLLERVLDGARPSRPAGAQGGRDRCPPSGVGLPPVTSIRAAPDPPEHLTDER